VSDAAIGFLLAIICSISFGAYILPRKLSKLSVLDYQFWVAAAIAPLMMLTAFLARAPLLVGAVQISIGIVCGALWTAGSISYSAAVDHIGVTRSTPVKNLAPAFAAFYGISIFREYVITRPLELLMTVGGVALMVFAALLIGRIGAHEHETAIAYDINRPAPERKTAFRIGMASSMGAAFFYGAYSVPLKWLFKHGVSAYTACAWLGVGVLSSTVAVYLLRERRLLPARADRREFLLCSAAGGIWSSGQIVGALAMLYIPMSVSWPVSNLGTLVAIGWGVLVFKEARIRENKAALVLSIIIYLAGLALLAWSAPAGKV
jgi:glucose uptake protein GlcU